MRIFLLENESSVDQLVYSPLYTRGVDVILCFNYLVVVKLKRMGDLHVYVFCEDMLSSDDYEKLHAVADRIDLNWYKSGVEDPTIYQDISFGHLVRGVLSRKYMLPVLVKYGEIIRKACLRWPACNEIIYDLKAKGISGYMLAEEYSLQFDKNLLVEEVCRQIGIRSQYFSSSRQLLVAVNSTGLSRGVQHIIKSILNDKIINFTEFLSSIVNLFNCQKSIYFSNYSNINSVLSHHSSRFVLRSIGGGRLILKSLAALLRGVRYVNFGRAHYTPTSGDGSFLRRIKSDFMKESGERGGLYTFNGINYEKVYSGAINDLVLHVIPQLVMHIGKVRSVLRKYRIGILVDIDMLDEKSKATCAVSRLEGVKVVYLDHGIQSHRKAMKALILDEPDVVIGPGVFDPYHHQAPRILLGNPSMDKYPIHKRKIVKEINRVLFLSFEDNFYARLDRFAYQEKYYEEIFSIFSSLDDSDIQIYYKPHPSESREYHEYLFRFFNLDRSIVNYVENVTFDEIVRDMDLVVSNVSSCFHEALAAGIPAVFFEPHFIEDALCPPLNGTHGEDVLRFEKGSELIDFIMSYRSDTTYLNQFVSNFLNTQAVLYMGQLDGLSGKRIVDYISSLDCSTGVVL